MNIKNQETKKTEQHEIKNKFIFRKNKVKNVASTENYVRKKIIKKALKQD